MRFIEHLVEPERLLLVWQAPDGKDRTRFVVGELLREGEQISFRYLTNSSDYARASELGFVYYPAFRKSDRVYTDGVMDTFMRRLPPSKRGDFAKYLEQWRIRSDQKISDFALLAYSGAKLPTDGFSIDWPMGEVVPPCEILVEVAGYRYQEGIAIDELSEGTTVHLQPEPNNPEDTNAIAVIAERNRIGYIKRTQRIAIAQWLNSYDVDVRIERINGTPDRPIIYLYCAIREIENLGLSNKIAV